MVGNVCNDIIVKVSQKDNESERDYIGDDGNCFTRMYSRR